MLYNIEHLLKTNWIFNNDVFSEKKEGERAW